MTDFKCISSISSVKDLIILTANNDLMKFNFVKTKHYLELV